MALNKLTYVDNVTVIPASNLNAIQDEVIANASNISTNTTDIASAKSEVEDIRVGADGTTYASAGDAVRGQVGDLKSELSDLYTMDKLTKPSGGGQVFSYEITAGTTYWFTNLTNNNTVGVRTCTSDGTEIETVKTGFAYNETVEFVPTQNASYVRIYSGVNDTTVSIGKYGVRIDSLAENDKRINNIIGYEWDKGHYIDANGNYSNGDDRACTNYIPCEPFASLTYVAETNHSNICGISYYDGNYGFISGEKNVGTIGTAITTTVPANAAFFRLSTTLAILTDSYVKFNGSKNSATLAVARKALNNTVYVDNINGSDSTGTGTQTNPYKTINHALQTGATDIGIYPALAYTETININTTGRIHLFAVNIDWGDGSNPTRIKAKFNGNNTTSTILTIQNAREVILEDIEVQNCTGDGCLLNKCENVTAINCSFYNNGNNGIVINYTNGVFHSCIAYDNGHDGFNLNYYGHTEFYDCSGWNNADDGISHHEGTTGLIDGGEWYGNTKGGVASPCYGARVDIQNVYSHNNGYGIYAFALGTSDARGFRVWNSVLKNNSNYGIAVMYNQPTLYGNKITDNTTGQTTAYGTTTFIELD